MEAGYSVWGHGEFMMWRTVTIIIIVVECGRCGKKLPKWPLVTVQDDDLKKCIYKNAVSNVWRGGGINENDIRRDG